MEQSTTAPRPDRAGPSHDDDGQILSPAQEKLLEQIAARAPHGGAGPEPQPSTTQQNASDALGTSSATAPASERQQSSDPPQPLRPEQERLIEGAQPATSGLEQQSPRVDGPTTPARALVGPLDSVFRSLRWATQLACSIVLLLTVTLLATLVNQVRLFPGWLQPIGYVALAVALVVAGWVLYGLGSRFARRVTTPKVRLSVESYLDQTHLLRGLYHHHQLTEVRAQLARLVHAYELTPQQRALLLRCGATHQQLESLTMGRGRLIDRLADEPPATWIVRCHNEFYAVLNDIARTCCYRAMVRLFGTTAIASHGLIDSGLVLCVTLTHLDNLCQIYTVLPIGALDFPS
jgi:hypothetical protein